MEAVLAKSFGIDINRKSFNRRFRSLFGMSFYVANIVALKIDEPVIAPYFLLALHFLKNYSPENVMSTVFNLDEKTVRKWIRIYVRIISQLSAISFDDRYENSPRGTSVFVSVDGVDCPFKETSRPVDPSYCSHKLKRSALRYEVGVALYAPRICWVAGGLPAGRYTDINIARENRGLIEHLVHRNERGVADNGYDGEETLFTPIRGSGLTHNVLSYNIWIRKVLARHEIVNKRLKHFGVLNSVFRHKEEFHRECFMACAVLTQLSMQEEPIHDISL